MKTLSGNRRLGVGAALPVLFALAVACLLSVSSADAAMTSAWLFDGSSTASPNQLGANLSGGSISTAQNQNTGGTASLLVAQNQSFTITFNPAGLSGFTLNYYIRNNGGSGGNAADVQWTYSTPGGSGNLSQLNNAPDTFGPQTVSFTGFPDVSGYSTLSFTATVTGGQNNNGAYFDNLSLTAVPEPINYAMAVFGLVFVCVGAGRFYLGRRRSAAVS
jgi:hypothetical protein